MAQTLNFERFGGATHQRTHTALLLFFSGRQIQGAQHPLARERGQNSTPHALKKGRMGNRLHESPRPAVEMFGGRGYFFYLARWHADWCRLLTKRYYVAQSTNFVTKKLRHHVNLSHFVTFGHVEVDEPENIVACLCLNRAVQVFCGCSSSLQSHHPQQHPKTTPHLVSITVPRILQAPSSCFYKKKRSARVETVRGVADHDKTEGFSGFFLSPPTDPPPSQHTHTNTQHSLCSSVNG